MLALLLADFELPRWQPLVIPLIGVASFGLALLVGRVFFGRRRSASGASPPSFSKVEQPVPSPDPFLQGSANEKRSSIRREGNTVEVVISDADATAAPVPGWVVDRSMGGLCLSVFDPVKTGCILSIKPKHAPGMTLWVQVEVRSCRQERSGWILGCQFVRTPPWSVMLLFG